MDSFELHSKIYHLSSRCAFVPAYKPQFSSVFTSLNVCSRVNRQVNCCQRAEYQVYLIVVLNPFRPISLSVFRQMR